MGIFAGIIYFIFCIIVACGASNRGRSGIGFFLISLILTPLIGFIILIILGEKKNINENINQNVTVNVSGQVSIPSKVNEYEQQKNLVQDRLNQNEKIKIKNIAKYNFIEILKKNNLDEYIEIFNSNKLIEIDVVKDLNEDDLDNIGITILGDRKKIINIIKNINIELKKLEEIGIDLN
jgi:hypothetical protein